MWRCLKTQHTLTQTALAKKHHDQAVSHANSMETKAVKAVALPPATLRGHDLQFHSSTSGQTPMTGNGKARQKTRMSL